MILRVLEPGKSGEVKIPNVMNLSQLVWKILRCEQLYCFFFRNILCFPIKDDSGVVIGVAQLCNKIGGIGFSTFDEEIAQAFSIYCCISIMHVRIHANHILHCFTFLIHICSLCGMKPKTPDTARIGLQYFHCWPHCFVCWIIFHHQEIESAAIEKKITREFPKREGPFVRIYIVNAM